MFDQRTSISYHFFRDLIPVRAVVYGELPADLLAEQGEWMGIYR